MRTIILSAIVLAAVGLGLAQAADSTAQYVTVKGAAWATYTITFENPDTGARIRNAGMLVNDPARLNLPKGYQLTYLRIEMDNTAASRAVDPAKEGPSPIYQVTRVGKSGIRIDYLGSATGTQISPMGKAPWPGDPDNPNPPPWN